MQLHYIPARDRFAMREGWLDTKWHFSFGHYHDPANVHFGALRVFNDDIVAPASGFDTHPHADMEIVTVMLSGTLEHRDSTGGHATLRAGDVQRMTAGTGVQHSEKNPSPDEPAKLLQIWVLPERRGLQPSYEQAYFDPARRVGRLQRVVTPHPTGGELPIHQDASFFLGTVPPGSHVVHEAGPGRRHYLFVVSGRVRVGDRELEAGDQGRITGAERLDILGVGDGPADVVLIDLAD